MGKALGSTRVIVLCGVLASLVIATVLFLATLAHIWLLLRDAVVTIDDPKGLKLLAVDSVELVDICLLATVLYLVAIGLYTLFIGEIPLPRWLHIRSLEQLKNEIINVIVVVLAATFLSQIAAWNGSTDLLPFGAAIAAVILALSAFRLVRLPSGRATADHASDGE